MNANNDLNKENILLRIARHLMINASFLDDIGLYHGKMGIVLFFSHYAHYIKNSIYYEFAGELLDEVFEELHVSTSFNFEAGLCGIGWGVEYLLQNGFMEGDSDEILSDIDLKIMELDLFRIVDKSVRTGVKGIGYYIEKRINSKKRAQIGQPFDREFMSNWMIIKKQILIPSDEYILNAMIEILPSGNNILKWRLGLENGCAGYGLNQIYLQNENV